MTPDQIKALPLGTKVYYTAKTHNATTDTRPYTRTVEAKSLSAPVFGIYVGYRSIPTGVLYSDPDDGPMFRQTGAAFVALVVAHPRHTAARVFPEHLHLEESAPSA